MSRIIGLTGKMGAGKSTVFAAIRAQTNKEVHLVKFADPLYDMQRYIYGRVGRKIPDPKDRKLLQWLGTEWGRAIDENIWVNAWQQDVARALEMSPTSTVVCDDCRFDNEAEKIKSLGGKIILVQTAEETRVSRNPSQVTHTGHASENGIDFKYVDDILVNDGTKTQLAIKVDAVLKRWGI